MHNPTADRPSLACQDNDPSLCLPRSLNKAILLAAAMPYYFLLDLDSNRVA